MTFANRTQAGRQLAAKLKPYATNSVVYALPRGGTPVGAEVAKALDAPLTLAISRKIGHPSNPEYAVCAVTETGPLICDPLEQWSVDARWLSQAEAAERAEAARRRQVFGAPDIPPTGKTAIVVDDGVATGLTLRAALLGIRSQHPAQLIVAIPVCPRDVAESLRQEANALVALHIPRLFAGSVGSYYRDFSQLDDKDVTDIFDSIRSS